MENERKSRMSWKTADGLKGEFVLINILVIYRVFLFLFYILVSFTATAA